MSRVDATAAGNFQGAFFCLMPQKWACSHEDFDCKIERYIASRIPITQTSFNRGRGWRRTEGRTRGEGEQDKLRGEEKNRTK